MSAVRIATRKSPLALWQANHIAERLRREDPGAEVSLLELSTEGDRFLSAPLSAIGGKGLFVKEIEQALIDGRADLAVHSLKDMTSQMPSELCLAAVPEREDPRDALVGRTAGVRFATLPPKARLGTSSLRRTAQLLERRQDLQVVSIRGNVQTRLRKIDEEDLAGAVLALAGLRRLGLEGRVTEVFEPEATLPAVGQGVLALQCRTGDSATRRRLEALEHADTRVAITAERAFLARLEGGCSVPLAGYATVSARGGVYLRGLVGRPDGSRVLRAERRGAPADAERMGTDLARELLANGAAEILEQGKRG